MKNVLVPRSLTELRQALHDLPEAKVFAGGTDLLVNIRQSIVNPPSLICLDRIDELKGITRLENDAIRIGACTTHTDILADNWVRSHLPVLTQAVRCLGSPPIRNMGTIGGNLCTASPAGDTIPPLYILEAEIELMRESGVRKMPISEFILGPGKTCLEKGEILSSIQVKKPVGYNLHHFEKVGYRNALACAVASLAAMLQISPEGRIEKAALAWGSVGPVIFTCQEAVNVLVGKRISVEELHKAANIVQKAVSPISDIRAGAEYRRIVSGNLLLRLMEKVQTIFERPKLS